MTYELPKAAVLACASVYDDHEPYYTADQMQATHQAGREAALLPLLDLLVVLHIYRKEHDTDTALAIKELVDWEIEIALDPQVSSDAQALIDRGRKEMREECVRACIDIATAPSNCTLGVAIDCADKIKSIK